MKVKTLALMAGLGGSLFLAGQADAAYENLSSVLVTTQEIDGNMWDVYRVYANVSSMTDTVEALSGNAANPVVVTTTGSFYQNKAFGVNIVEPNPLLIPVNPALEWDTFLTIGNTAIDTPTVAMGATQTQGIDASNFMSDSIMIDNGAWFRTPGNAATVAMNGAGTDLQILIGQFTISAGSTGEGIVRVAGNFDGESTQFIGQTFTLPAPGALALLGLAGLAGGRRRRRA